MSDKIVEGIAKIIEARDKEIVESLCLSMNDIGEVRFPEEIAQAIKDSLVIDDDKIERIINKDCIGHSTVYPNTTYEEHWYRIDKKHLAEAISKADVIKIKEK